MGLFDWKKNKNKKTDPEKIDLIVKEKDIQEGLYEEVNDNHSIKDQKKKRRFLRYNSANSLWYSVSDSEAPIKEVGITRQIALGGLGMQTFSPVDKGKKLMMEILMDDDRHIRLTSQVVYCTSQKDGTFDVGVQFVRVQGEDLLYLKTKFPPKEDV